MPQQVALFLAPVSLLFAAISTRSSQESKTLFAFLLLGGILVLGEISCARRFKRFAGSYLCERAFPAELLLPRQPAIE